MGGVAIPFDKGLLGHSDADVLAHAVSDALLGAAGLGDIGGMFPDDDPATLGADSLELLRQVTARLSRDGWHPVNIDATVIAQSPKMKPYISAMRDRLADALRNRGRCSQRQGHHGGIPGLYRGRGGYGGPCRLFDRTLLNLGPSLLELHIV